MTRREWTDEEKAALTTEIGYTGPHESFVGREWRWLDSHRPDLNIYCRETGKRVGHAGYAPDGQVWFRSGPRQGQLGDWLTEGGTCPACARRTEGRCGPASTSRTPSPSGPAARSPWTAPAGTRSIIGPS